MLPDSEALAQTGLTTVTLTAPASAPYLSLLRVTTANVMARMEFTLDEIEDARIGVSEATALLLEQDDHGDELTAVFTAAPDTLTVALTIWSPSAHQPDATSFAWVVLSTLLEEVSSSHDDGLFTLQLTKKRGI